MTDSKSQESTYTAQRTRKTLPAFITGTAQQKYLCAEDGARSAGEGGYTHWYVDGSLEGERPADWSPSRIDALLAIAQDEGVRPIYHGNFKVPIASDVAEVRATAIPYVRSEIDVCAALGAPLILHGGGIVEPRSVRHAKGIALDGLVESLLRITEYAQQRGVAVWLENLCNYTNCHPFYYIFTRDEEFEYVLDRVHGIDFILDVSHAYVNGGDPVKTFEAFRKRIVAMAFSDNNSTADSHLPLGRGTLNYPGLVDQIMAANWQGTISFETRGSELDHSIDHLTQLVGDREWTCEMQ